MHFDGLVSGNFYSYNVATMKRIDYWKARLKAAQVEERIRQKEVNQMAKAFERALAKVNEIEQRIENEKDKLARAK